MRKWTKKVGIVVGIYLTLSVTGCSEAGGSKQADPTEVTIWHYYNGAQKENFDILVNQFNETVGRDKKIVVEAFSKSSVNDLEQAIQDGLSDKVGADKLPNAYAAYSDTAYKVDNLGAAVDLSQYWSQEEQAEYIDAYIEEGRFDGTDSVKLFPIAKSTEVFAINLTDWNQFAEATGASDASFATWEGIAQTAEKYYKWTDSLTKTPEDGKAFFGRDAFANYMLVGSRQLGHEIYHVEAGKPVLDFDKDAMKRLWDNYYIPYINGYFGSYGKFRSDDIKTGDLLALVGSTSGMTFFPSAVTKEDGTTYEIESRIYPLPNFEGTEPWAVQQGAGMLVLKSDEKSEKATVEFLKWFTEESVNLSFSVESGYLPVKKSANDKDKLAGLLESGNNQSSPILKQCLYTGLDILNTYSLYTAKPFEGGMEARNILNTSMDQKAKKDRETVERMIENGVSREEAVARFATEDKFNQWYEMTKQELTAIGE